ncbi:MAG: hypothetical protein QF741_00265 [Candidatus Peribacteraceae bacterium]|jgi:hypothetical protein|nr:hypothetical protein [Candidatus Peribacteraceae bacterium]MDP7454179.1 hypothetical protein [Candidatus Peribacteraceae bacterium]MDP7645708.1 hypothetical protein [Candidatus Peribacteraceae bacterium]
MTSESRRDGPDQESPRAICIDIESNNETNQLLRDLKQKYEKELVHFGLEEHFDGSDQYAGERHMWLDRVCKLCVLTPLLEKGGVNNQEAKEVARRALKAKLPDGAGELEEKFDEIFRNAYGVILKVVSHGVEGYLRLANAKDPNGGGEADAVPDKTPPPQPVEEDLEAYLERKSEQDPRPQQEWTIKRTLRDRLAEEFRRKQEKGGK